MINVIIVDDEVLARIGIKSFLENKENISVKGCFGSAKEALDYLHQSGGTDIVITDIEMSEMTGLEFIDALNKQQLAKGTIIISSYSDFEYARQAMKLEADSYILKQEINENNLVAEIEKIYKQKIAVEFKEPKEIKGIKQFADEREQQELCYRIGVLKIQQAYDAEGNNISGQVNESMLVSLLESVLGNYENGYLFVPYQKEMFVVFQFSRIMEENERQSIIEDVCYDLQQNIKLYINRTMVIGMSGMFEDFKQVQAYYQHGLNAAGLGFYDIEKPLFYTDEEISQEVPEYAFSSDNFLDDEGVSRFEKELTGFLTQCGDKRVGAERVQQALITKLNVLVYKVLHEYSFPLELMEKWDQKFQYFQVISGAENSKVMVMQIIRIMENFQTDLLTQLKEEEFSNVFRFVDQHLDGKISLTEMAELNCMSTASFCKKFKERTGLTLIQYINLKKIEQVKGYLKNDDYSLGQIAEMSGFCNENYMIRVFKRVTGQTVKDYKKGKL